MSVFHCNLVKEDYSIATRGIGNYITIISVNELGHHGVALTTEEAQAFAEEILSLVKECEA